MLPLSRGAGNMASRRILLGGGGCQIQNRWPDHRGHNAIVIKAPPAVDFPSISAQECEDNQGWTTFNWA